jgi:hypothetical protein
LLLSGSTFFRRSTDRWWKWKRETGNANCCWCWTHMCESDLISHSALIAWPYTTLMKQFTFNISLAYTAAYTLILSSCVQIILCIAAAHIRKISMRECATYHVHRFISVIPIYFFTLGFYEFYFFFLASTHIHCKFLLFFFKKSFRRNKEKCKNRNFN